MRSRRQCVGQLSRLTELVSDVPGKEFLDTVDRVIGDPFENVLQIALRVDAIQFTTLDKTVNDRDALAAAVGAEEEIITPPDAYTADRAVSGSVVDLELSVFGVAAELSPALEGVHTGASPACHGASAIQASGLFNAGGRTFSATDHFGRPRVPAAATCRAPPTVLLLAICVIPYVLATTGSSSSTREGPIHGPRPHGY